jgi:hypothetical protein
MNTFRASLVSLLLVTSTATAAPRIQLSFSEGRVWLTADGATAAQILAEWARLGGTRIVNAERISSEPLTLEMPGVPERDALDVLLKSASGYIAMSRTPELRAAFARQSQFDRVAVLPSSTRVSEPVLRGVPVPAEVPTLVPPPPPVFAPSGGQRLIGPDGQPVPDDQEGAPAPVVTTPPAPPPATKPGPTFITAPGSPVPGVMPPKPTQR